MQFLLSQLLLTPTLLGKLNSKTFKNILVLGEEKVITADELDTRKSISNKPSNKSK